jgi:hypothetical protein
MCRLVGPGAVVLLHVHMKSLLALMFVLGVLAVQLASSHSCGCRVWLYYGIRLATC